MTNIWNVRVYESGQLVYEDDFAVAGDRPLELGRQGRGDPAPFGRLTRPNGERLVLAAATKVDISRQQALLAPRAASRVHLRNLSKTQPVGLPDGATLAPEASAELALPVLVTLGERVAVRVQLADHGGQLHTLPAARLPQKSVAAPSIPLSILVRSAGGAIDSKALLQWLQRATDVLQAAADSEDFFDQAAAAAGEMAGLDSGQVLLRQQGEWRTQARKAGQDHVGEARASRRVLARVLAEKQTCWEVLDFQEGQQSLAGVEVVVAAPILSRDGEVIGAVYGERRRRVGPGAAAFTEVEAMLVELLARGVAAGLARLDQERSALSAQVRFEQFFTPDLARQLAQHPDLLEGREVEVTVLFCDIRGFSRVTERLGPALSLEWTSDVLGELSECVLAEGGVLVDYVGDELLAMWGAPEAQPDQASRACRAALAMLARLPALNERWRGRLGEATGLGIGINSGPAQVGNIGSRFKFKYGPRGNTVNVASRVQGATKRLNCPVLITGPTRAALTPDFATRRLCEVQVVNIAAPVELYELAPAGQPDWVQGKEEYERALLLFEMDEFGLAAHTLGNWTVRHAGDGPALVLLYRAVRCMVEGAPAGHPVWVLEGK